MSDRELGSPRTPGAHLLGQRHLKVCPSSAHAMPRRSKRGQTHLVEIGLVQQSGTGSLRHVPTDAVSL